MKASSLIIIQVGTPPNVIREAYGDLSAWFCQALQCAEDNVDVIRVFEGAPLPQPDANRVAIITGSWAMVTDRLPWSEITAQWIRDAMAMQMPLFGVCYGHQLMAHALGGYVDYHPAGREIGCREIQPLALASNDPLISTLPSRFHAHLTHMQSILRLPTGAQALAASDHDPYQIVRYGPNALSTQFHPEFTPEILTAIINRQREALLDEGLNIESLLHEINETPVASKLLRDFVRAHLR